MSAAEMSPAEMSAPIEFPSDFLFQNCYFITGRVFELKENPYREEAAQIALRWFDQYEMYEKDAKVRFLKTALDAYAAFAYPTCDLENLVTGMMFLLWAFTADDISDRGDMQTDPDKVFLEQEFQRDIAEGLIEEKPQCASGAMFFDIIQRMRRTATPGAMRRFIDGHRQHGDSQIIQSQLRRAEEFCSVEEYIILHRIISAGVAMQAFVEYTSNINLPDYVFEHPTMVAISDTVTDLLSFANDLCSFNKEQADGDYQNLVCIIMIERDCDLQTAVDTLTDMLAQRVQDYVIYKHLIPSWDPEVDAEVSRYIKGVEHMVQGSIYWYHLSKRYFPRENPVGKDFVIVDLLKPTKI